jgi:hypothetical protein
MIFSPKPQVNVYRCDGCGVFGVKDGSGDAKCATIPDDWIKVPIKRNGLVVRIKDLCPKCQVTSGS